MKHLLIILLTVSALLPAREFWRQGEPTLPIVVSVDAPEPARQAAYELSQWLDKATGVPWKVTAAHPDASRPAIYLGQAASAGIDGAPETVSMPHDGFWYRASGNAIRIAGRDYEGGSRSIFMHPMRDVECWNPDLRLSAFGDMGTWYGVHHFLEKLGFRWYMPGELGAVVPALTSLEIPEEEETISPAFEYRYAWLCNFPDDPRDALWYRRVGFGAPTPVNIIHSYWMFTDKYAEEHPEYFALADGESDTSDKCALLGGGHLCLSNEEVLRHWIDDICQYFEENPDQDLFPLCPNDGVTRICECSDCQADLSPHLGEKGVFSNHIWKFADKVASGVGARMPDKRVGCFAYEKYREVPDCLTELSPNLAVMICYTRQELRDPAKKANIRGLIEGWSKLTSGLYFWTYPHKDYWTPWRGFPRFYPEILAEDIRANARLHAKGEFLESEAHNWNEPDFKGYDYHWPALYHLTAYVTVKLLWNPDTDIRALLEDYYQRFYGPAAPQMKAFWEMVETITMKRNCVHPVTQYTPEEIRTLLLLIQEGIQACPEDSVYAERIQELHDEMAPYCEPMLHLAERAPMTIPFFPEQTLPLDGSLWPNAARQEFVDKYGMTVDFRTEVLMAGDKEGLVFTFLCYDEPPEELVAETHLHDKGPIWSDSSVELFFCQPDGTDGRTIILNAKGNSFDASWKDVEEKDDMSWDPQLTIHTETRPDNWLVQVRIPWSELGIKEPARGTPLLGNLYRNFPLGKHNAKYSAFAPTFTHNHRLPNVFVPVVLK